MAFDFEGFWRFTRKSIFESKKNYQLTPKRVAWLALFYTVYGLLEAVTWLGFLLDDILFPRYREIQIKEPVYIIGNPRSGTTFLQRLMAKDRQTFISMRTWEMLLAPSITMRKVGWALATFDRWLGGPLTKLLTALERRWAEENVIHRVALSAPEEDEYLLFHIWSNLKIWLYVAMVKEAKPYTHFDSAMSEEDKRRILTFYKRCLQRHLYAHQGGDRHYLSKNPSFTPWVDTLYEYFPDIKIIYLARNPLDMVPSYISLKEEEWQLLGDPVKEYASRDYVLEMAHHWYTYPLERLARAPEESYVIVNFNDLVNDAKGTIARIYDRFDLEIGPEFSQILLEAAKEARNHESLHEYSLQEMGLTREGIVSQFQEVFDRFNFDTREGRG